MARERSYRATFSTEADHARVGLDFYADNRALALDHAETIARDAALTLLKVRALNRDDVYDAGSFYLVTPPPPAAPELASLLRYPAPRLRRRGKGVA